MSTASISSFQIHKFKVQSGKRTGFCRVFLIITLNHFCIIPISHGYDFFDVNVLSFQFFHFFLDV